MSLYLFGVELQEIHMKKMNNCIRYSIKDIRYLDFIAREKKDLQKCSLCKKNDSLKSKNDSIVPLPIDCNYYAQISFVFLILKLQKIYGTV